ncbi:efflux RND transporter periplasmic adaptor subunit [Vibrio algarum]
MTIKAFITMLKLSTIASMGLLLTGCEQANSETQNDVIKPVKLYQVPSISSSGYDVFLGEVDAGDRSQLSFQVPGVIELLNVKEGQKVSQGEVLAVLDDTDYQLAVDASQAQFDLEKTRLERNKQLFNKKLISADAFDQSETAFKAADANLEEAKTDLQYTQITAPFSGVVSLKFVQPFQYVSSKQPVLNIINNENLDVNIVIPVPYIDKAGIHSLPNREYAVIFDINNTIVIPAQFKEMSTQPNVDTNSYSATVTIVRPESFNILTGMTGQVLLSNNKKENRFSIPNDAWIVKETAKSKVWKFNQTTHIVESVEVELDEFGAVVAGLKAGDQIVVAGAQNLKEGQMVRPWTREGGI